MIRVTSAATAAASHQRPVEHQAIVLRFANIKRLTGTRAQRRAVYAQLERDPALRRLVLATWDHSCQVDGCAVVNPYPPDLRHHLLDVHHLNHVSDGGSDSPLNICLICSAHHALIHRGPSPELTSSSASEARITIAGTVLRITRQARELW